MTFKLPLFPLNTVLFPGAPLLLHIFEERYRQMIARCLERAAAQRDDRGIGRHDGADQ
jgi:Lon protease-like protein